MTVYYASKLVMFGVIVNLNNESFGHDFAMGVSMIETLVLVLTMWNYRPRVWPSFFTLDIHDIREVSLSLIIDKIFLESLELTIATKRPNRKTLKQGTITNNGS